jgi:hypothetical protein
MAGSRSNKSGMPGKERKRKPEDAPLGTGMADKARKWIQERKKKQKKYLED